uniref:Uncharacterized protein n=1 Tax=Globisporangium ultimum (strain ATCC 200006 / CBS 805.95 / DAOM BR144) TaxID=431595 RepID=K3X9T0_GLOUD
MLPNTLTPAFIVPGAASQRLRLFTALKNIGFVEVKSAVGNEGERMYAIESHEYASTTSRIPTAVPTTMQDRSSTQPSRDCTAQSNRVVARVERDYSAFDDLRLNVFFVVRSAHYRAYCDFCRSVVSSFDTAKNRPGTVLRLLGSDRKIVQTFTKFLNTLLGIVKHNEAAALECNGQDQACVLLHAFLFKQE